MTQGFRDKNGTVHPQDIFAVLQGCGLGIDQGLALLPKTKEQRVFECCLDSPDSLSLLPSACFILFRSPSFYLVASGGKQMMGNLPPLRETWRIWRDGSACWAITRTRVKTPGLHLTSQATPRWLQHHMRNPMSSSGLGAHIGMHIGT